MTLLMFMTSFASESLVSDVEKKIHKAEEAFQGGDTARALEIYKEVLKVSPDHLGALKRAAQFSSWEGQFDESIVYYEQAIRLDPQDTRLKVKLAEVYSWNNDFDSSIESYSQLLKENPDDTLLQLKLARVLSWAKMYHQSISEYKKILGREADHREAKLGLAQVLSWKGDFKQSIDTHRELLKTYPDDVEILLGLARVLSWDGQLKESQKFYREILAIQPDHLEAQIGLSRTLLWMGEKRESLNLAEKAMEDHSQNPEVQELYREIKRSVRPTLITGYDYIDDTDDNRIDVYRAAFLFRPEPQTDLGINYTRYDLDLRGASASVDSYFLSLASRINARHSIYARVGGDWIKDDIRASRSFFVGALSYKYSTGDRFYWSVGAARDTFKASVTILEKDIRVDTAYVDFYKKLKDPWSIFARYEVGDLSDNNARTNGFFTLKYAFPVKNPSFALGYKFRYLAYDENFDNGYFDPQQFTAHLAIVEVSGTLSDQLFYYNLQADAGIQNFHFDLNGVREESDNDRVLGFTGVFGFHIGERASVEFYYNHSDYALQVGTGFESTQSGVRLIVHF
jgi:tetratricopeptide (TPR) repeat protein